ncbi:NADPH:quinone oxidoreductase family protein [Alsobacter sp. SYSU M60028]|uniref:NADPH:quinone oxidoreductase family protein n=1 Tax=Alsobacter ponti TaxID=2962936 RepID=A0ABT1LE96_9HYPH|nr:NADPH:quinone oxidoreductase family protein [Alsobacter ponti]MCP8939784.1 NADPH:quinone oxidoreductase family protein [Alsobacter ponti]
MRAVLCKEFGPPESLVVAELPEPTPGPGEVVVAIAVAALNFFDTLIIENRYQFKPDLPFSPGAEFAGRVVALGKGVRPDWLGARVAGFAGWGACREKLSVAVDRLARIPDGLSDEAAAGLSVTYGTTLHALADRARLRPEETLAVLGAAGGVGIAAVEIGKLMGARVIACASSPEKLEVARRHGADDLLDYAAGDLKEGLRRLTGGAGVDVIYDPVGGALAEAALRSIAWKGRFLVVGFAAGEIPKLPLNLVLLKGCDVQGVFWGAFTEKEPEANAANVAKLLAWAGEGRIATAESAVFPLEETGRAIRLIADRKATGKVLVRM